jgi:hypothetical protein
MSLEEAVEACAGMVDRFLAEGPPAAWPDASGLVEDALAR